MGQEERSGRDTTSAQAHTVVQVSRPGCFSRSVPTDQVVFDELLDESGSGGGGHGGGEGKESEEENSEEQSPGAAEHATELQHSDQTKSADE